jgi:hypothetical protein
MSLPRVRDRRAAQICEALAALLPVGRFQQVDITYVIEFHAGGNLDPENNLFDASR